MSPQQSTSDRKMTLLLIAVFWALVIGSYAYAGTPGGAIVARNSSQSNHAYGSRTVPLKLTLPALPTTRLQPSSVAREEVRPVQPLPTARSLEEIRHESSTAERPNPGIAIQWRESREIVSPEVVSLVRNYRRDGLPIVHLYQSQQNLLAIGLNNHGLPGIYFTRHIGG